MAPGPTALNPAHFSFHPRGPVAPPLVLASLTSRPHGSASVFRMPSLVRRIALAPLPCGPSGSGSSSRRNRMHRRHHLRNPRLTRPTPMILGRSCFWAIIHDPYDLLRPPSSFSLGTGAARGACTWAVEGCRQHHTCPRPLPKVQRRLGVLRCVAGKALVDG
jgi:hypothetical protein